ncbi:19790_t:CDS:1, partial [Racocetra fulgida]
SKKRIEEGGHIGSTQKQNRRQTRYGINIPDYSEQESDHEPEKVRDMPFDS